MASSEHWAHRRRLCPLWNAEVLEGKSSILAAFDFSSGVVEFKMVSQADQALGSCVPFFRLLVE